jgi:sugar lactone lactonase YvrE
VTIGKTEFTSSAPAVSRVGLAFPYGLAFDHLGDLWASDARNNRIIEYVPPFSTGMPSAHVIGQKDFTSRSPGLGPGRLNIPLGIAFDSQDNLWVADRSNHRVLEFRSPFTDGMNASAVIGQTNYTSRSYGVSATSLNSPSGLAFGSSGNLWVVDEQNSRVLEFIPPFTNGMAASLAIGQHNFTTNFFSTSQRGLTLPYGAVFDSSGNLWVADTSDNRVLQFRPPYMTDMNASVVMGEPNFFTSGSGITSKSGLIFPTNLAFDRQGNLWVSEVYNNRTVEFSPPFSSGEEASLVIGQPDFLSREGATLSVGLNSPDAIAFDTQGNLWLADTSNNRILEYNSLVTAQAITAAHFTGGSASADQTNETGVTLAISGSPSKDGTQVTLITQSLGGQPASTSPTHLNKTVFRAVQISEIINGSVRFCLSDPSIGSNTVISYWNSTGWKDASKISQSGKSICGTVPAAALSNTWLVIGETTPKSRPLSLLLIGSGIAAAGAAVVAIVWKLTRTRSGVGHPPSPKTAEA